MRKLDVNTKAIIAQTIAVAGEFVVFNTDTIKVFSTEKEAYDYCTRECVVYRLNNEGKASHHFF